MKRQTRYFWSAGQHGSPEEPESIRKLVVTTVVTTYVQIVDSSSRFVHTRVAPCVPAKPSVCGYLPETPEPLGRSCKYLCIRILTSRPNIGLQRRWRDGINGILVDHRVMRNLTVLNQQRTLLLPY